MALFKTVKKPVIKSGGGSAEISALRPRYIPKAAPCAGHCPNGNEIRELLVTIACQSCGKRFWIERRPKEVCPTCGGQFYETGKRRRKTKPGFPCRKDCQAA